MKSAFLVVGSLLIASFAHAGMYKCIENGRATYQERPCKGAGGEIKLRSQSGDAPAPKAPTAATPNAKSNDSHSPASGDPNSWLQSMQKERRLRELDHEIKIVENDIRTDYEDLDAELAVLRDRKSYANNNLAGATWEGSISSEMQAIVDKYKTKISISQAKQDRLRKDREVLLTAK